MKKKKLLVLLFILLFPSLLYVVLTTGKHNFIHVQYFGPKQTVEIDGKIDTIYHQIPPFKFVNQLGDTVTDKTFSNKIYVADFIFTTCQSICPKMTSNMWHLQDKFMQDTTIMLLSHTVNPENDSAEVLNEYAKSYGVDNNKWMFVTGNKKDIYEIALHGYLVNASEDVMAPGGFLHGEWFVLVDQEKHIRGYYDGTNKKDMTRLADEIKVVKAEAIIKQEREKKKHER